MDFLLPKPFLNNRWNTKNFGAPWQLLLLEFQFIAVLKVIVLLPLVPIVMLLNYLMNVLVKLRIIQIVMMLFFLKYYYLKIQIINFLNVNIYGIKLNLLKKELMHNFAKI